MNQFTGEVGKKVLLVGGGHSNIQLLHALTKTDRSQVQVTLLSDTSSVSYSGMIPSYMAGTYSADQLHFDLFLICSRYNYKFIQNAAVRISAQENQVIDSEGNQFDYDICSVNIGIRPVAIPISAQANNSQQIIYLKPISLLINKWDQLIKRKQVSEKNQSEKQIQLFIVGGGAAGFETAVACRRRFSKSQANISLIAGSKFLLNTFHTSVQKIARERLKHHDIELIEGRSVLKIEANHIFFNDEKSRDFDICMIATSAQAPHLFQESDLPINDTGFVCIDETLLVKGSSNLFATGDCAYFSAQPLPKAGVFAVRQGSVLVRNIFHILNGKSELERYKPQHKFLSLLVSGENRAIASYGDFAVEGRIPWLLKNAIDLIFMRRFK